MYVYIYVCMCVWLCMGGGEFASQCFRAVYLISVLVDILLCSAVVTTTEIENIETK